MLRTCFVLAAVFSSPLFTAVFTAEFTAEFTADLAAETNPTPKIFVAHEWGTFTSVAAADGSPLQWAPLSGPADLPCFVVHLGTNAIKMMPATVRMETPVLYFYPQQAMTVSVHVDFPGGWITEWYPQASHVKPGWEFSGLGQGSIDWGPIQLTPDETAALPITQGRSHYFAARNTDSALLRVGDQREKLIFYRGIGNFAIPVHPMFTSDGKLEIRNTGERPIPFVMVFENHGGKTGYRIVNNFAGAVKLDTPQLSSDAAETQAALSAALEGSGLYRKEALAMIETWKDSWFEEGTRVFYILPRATVDRVLPLKITPAPADTGRVFVGRVEVLSPSVRSTIETALGKGDAATLTRFSRFLDPFVQQMGAGNMALRSPAGQTTFDNAIARIQKEINPGGCVR